jgi:hypothetical protein
VSDAMGLPGGPAFPISIPGCGDNGCPGMSLRDWFAGQALSGLMASHDWRHMYDCDSYAQDAYALADSMLGQRSKEQK